MPFAYYHRLSPRDRAIYRRSAAIQRLALPDVEALRPRVATLEAKLAAGDRRAVARAATRLLADLADAFDVAPVAKVRVLSVRPSDAEGELHGLYERELDDSAQITVWMKTAAQARVVAFRTFLRTLLHELCHHLDYELLDLPDTFHTEGFFARESDLMRQLAPAPEAPEPEDPAPEDPTSAQLELPW